MTVNFAAFHLVILHIPIGLMVGIISLHAYQRFLRLRYPSRSAELKNQKKTAIIVDSRPMLTFLWWLCASSLLLTAVFGQWLGNDGYQGELIDDHRLLGWILVICVFTTALSYHTKASWYRLMLVLSSVMMIVVGHKGASLTHGEDILFSSNAQVNDTTIPEVSSVESDHTHQLESTLFPRHSDDSSADFSHQSSGSPPGSLPALPPQPYRHPAWVMLQQRCVSCHGPQKQLGQLRLDSLAAIHRGGKSGSVVDMAAS